MGIADRVGHWGCVTMTRLRLTGRLLALALGATVLPGMAQAESFGGQARAISGDSLMVGERVVRLFGIDAPEAAQGCNGAGLAAQCGEAATRKLSQLVTGRQVQCIVTGVDTRKRTVAVCAAGMVDLNRTMTELGLATAQSGRGDVYLPVQARAKANHAGIWAASADFAVAPSLGFSEALK